MIFPLSERNPKRNIIILVTVFTNAIINFYLVSRSKAAHFIFLIISALIEDKLHIQLF